MKSKEQKNLKKEKIEHSVKTFASTQRTFDESQSICLAFHPETSNKCIKPCAIPKGDSNTTPNVESKI